MPMALNGEVSTRILDHIVHLTPPGTLEESVAAFRKLGFKVTPGGTHADGLTANALIVFLDGTYLELLHFTRAPPPSSTHPWAHKQPGWIDYASLGNAGTPSIADTINARADAHSVKGARYVKEVRGGRKREDGRVLEWLISAPERDGARGRLPFFCGDLTPREWRVPLEPRSNAEHPNTAQGIAHVKLLAATNELDAYAKQLTTVLGVPPVESTPAKVVWELEQQPSHRDTARTPTRLILSEPNDEEEEEHLRTRDAGMYELGVVVEDRNREGIARTPYGRVVSKLA
ncbi:hypothetical protein BV20DRAFT_962969 [Pilatotrama ljubarskyi]|nr:hypothetical protein BV20DRAFT_962969 [Pilatotrama ljubarskyi]